MPPDFQESATALRIERSSIHDGQGLRTVLFLKGCPLRCAWCSTPESQDASPERGFERKLCTVCGICVNRCPAKALTLAADNSVVTDNTLCRRCFTCAAVCPNRAVKRYGYITTPAEAMREIVKDEIFYYHSGGGVTLSGGEPLIWPGFTAAALRESKKLGIHTAIETCLYVDFASVETVLPWLDVLYADIKQMDSKCHARWTGAGNELILENILKADRCAFPPQIVVRIPLIPEINDTEANLRATAEFCLKLTKIKAIELLPYHGLGSDTYKHLGKIYRCAGLKPQPKTEIVRKAAYMQTLCSGIPVVAGSGFSAG